MKNKIKKMILDKRYKCEQVKKEIKRQISDLEEVRRQDKEKVHYEQTLTDRADSVLYREIRKLRTKKDKAHNRWSFWNNICKLLKLEVHKYEYEISFKTRTVTIVATDWYDAEKQINKLYRKTAIHGEFKREIE